MPTGQAGVFQSMSVMSAGKSFWHEEGVPEDGETAKIMQIFVRPHTVDLELSIQVKGKSAPTPDTCAFSSALRFR